MRLFAFILGITIPLLALFLSFMISPVLGNILFKPATYISAILDRVFIDMPYTIHSLLVFLVGTLFLMFFYFFTKKALKKLILKKRRVFV